MPARDLKYSPIRCETPPLPLDANVSSSGFGLRQCDQLRDRIGRHRRNRHQHHGGRTDQRHRREVRGRLVGERGEDARRDRMRAAGADQHRVAVRWGLRGNVGADRATGSAAIVDDHRLAQPVSQLLGDRTRDGIGRAAWRERYDEAQWPVWPGARLGLGVRLSGAMMPTLRDDERRRPQYEAGKSVAWNLREDRARTGLVNEQFSARHRRFVRRC